MFATQSKAQLARAFRGLVSFSISTTLPYNPSSGACSLTGVPHAATMAAASAAHMRRLHPRGAAASHSASDAWYSVRKEEQLQTPASTGDEDSFLDSAFLSRHPSSRFANVLSQLRAHFPEEVWHKVTDLFPDRAAARPVCIDIAVGSEGRGGVELARRGFHVVGVQANAELLARTFEFAQANSAAIELITAKVEHSLLVAGAADLVTFFHGLHLVDTAAALEEAWRLLKPGGKLVAAWNDRDLGSEFIRELEDTIERHVPSYNRYQKQRGVELWGEVLQEGGLFKLMEYSCHSNPVHVPSPAALLDVLDCMSFVRSSLRGAGRKRFNNDVRVLLDRRFGRRAFALPLESKVFVLEKIHEAGAGGGRKGHGHKTVFS